MSDEADNIEKFDIIPPSANDEDPSDKALMASVEAKNDRPSILDANWTEFVLSQFDEDELYKGRPTTDGLRRIVRKLLGPITRSVPVKVVPASAENEGRATVVWEIDILWAYDEDGLDPHTRTFGDVADVFHGNTKNGYDNFAAATAGTRAEGRALRKALQLKKVLAAEEVVDVSQETPTVITSGQIAYMKLMCGRNKISLDKLVEGLSKKEKRKIDSVNELTYSEAIRATRFLTGCQNGQEQIPESLLE